MFLQLAVAIRFGGTAAGIGGMEGAEMEGEGIPLQDRLRCISRMNGHALLQNMDLRACPERRGSDTRFHGDADHLRRGLHAELFHGEATVHFHRLFGQLQFPGDLLVPEAAGHQFEHFELSR